jgi:signal transduction histidine kinase
MKLITSLGAQPRPLVMVEIALLVAVVGLLDYVTGPELAFTVFYVVPVALATWRLGRRAGLVTAVAGSLTWLAGDLTTPHAGRAPLVPDWNALVLLLLLGGVAWVTSSLRASLRTQEQLSYFIVHDLRSPLAAMLMSLNALRSVVGDSMPERQRTLVAIALDAGDQMGTLINSLLDMAKLEHGSMKVEAESLGAAELVEAAVRQATPWAETAGLRIEVAIAPAASCVWCDRELTFRVLANLLANAIKHAPPGSTISVEAGASPAGEALLGVSDPGPGIPPQWLNRVFDKFEQVDARKSGAAVGTGLGLTFCRLAVQAQGGRIWVESQPGVRTTFRFTLPVCQTEG